MARNARFDEWHEAEIWTTRGAVQISLSPDLAKHLATLIGENDWLASRLREYADFAQQQLQSREVSGEK